MHVAFFDKNGDLVELRLTVERQISLGTNGVLEVKLE